jgi:teichuronic acid biosynthesis glycosyltransferase TuaC
VKILFHSNLFPDRAEIYRGQDNANLLHRLAEFAEIRVIAPRPALPFAPAQAIAPRDIDIPFDPVFPIYRYIPKVGSAFNHHLLRSAVRPDFVRIVESFNPDVLLASWAYPDTCGVVPLAKQYGLPVVAITQGSDVHIHLQMPLRRRLIPKALSSCEAVITRSNQLGQLLANAGVPKEKLHTVYNGVDPSIFHLGSQSNAKLALGLTGNAFRLLYVGNFYPVKNPFFLLQALAAVRQRSPDREVQLLMIGEGPLQGRVESTIRNLSLNGIVQLLGRKNSREVAEYMRAVDLLCIPSDNEGLPNVLLEAFACGLPVVSTDVGGIHEVLREEHLGCLVQVGKVLGLATAISKRMSIDPNREGIANYASQFSWELTVQDYRSILDSAL